MNVRTIEDGEIITEPGVPGSNGAEQLPIGIHFGVSDDVYFEQDALGSSDRKALAVDPVEWQFHRLHGEDKDTKAKIWGSALHCRVLEGFDAYQRRYAVAPEKEQFDGVLDTIPDLKAWLKAEGADFKSSANKGELVALVKALDPDVPIWEEIKADFEARYPEDRRLTQDMADGIEVAAQWLQGSAKLAPFMEGGTFKFGAPELTIIYEVDGVRCRARFDYVLPGVLVDIKTYRPWRNSVEPIKPIVQAIGNFRYDLQAAAYFEAYEIAKGLWRDGLVFGAEPYDGFLELVFGRDEPPTWLWIMIKNDGAPRPRIVEFPRELTVFRTAEIMIANALRDYRDMRDRFGLKADWQSDDPVLVLANEDFPNWFGIN